MKFLRVLLFWHSKCPRNISKRPKTLAAVNCRWISSYNPTVVNYRLGYFSNLLVLLRTSKCQKSNCQFLTLAVLAIEENEPMDFSQPWETRRNKIYRVKSPFWLKDKGWLQVAICFPLTLIFLQKDKGWFLSLKRDTYIYVCPIWPLFWLLLQPWGGIWYGVDAWNKYKI